MKTAWHLLYVRPRFEPLVVRYLQQQNLEHYWPVLRTRRDRKAIELPLFPGYVFARFVSDSRASVTSVPGVIWVMDVDQGDAEQDVKTLKRVINSGLRYGPGDYADAGTSAIAEDGPLQGLNGFLLNESRLIIPIPTVFRSVVVETDPTCMLVCDVWFEESHEPDAA